MRKLFSTLSGLLRDTRGNTAMLLGLCILPLGIFAGAAIDFSRVESNGKDLGANLDSAAIAAARYSMDNPEASKDDVKAYATSYITNSFGPDETKTLDNLVIEFVPEERVSMSAESTIQSTMLGLAKISSLTSKKKATASIGAPSGLRAVLVLDNSDSMNGPKMTALEDSATEFVSQLVENGGNSFVGVVPFNHYVNIGTSYKSEPWMDVPIATPKSHTSCSTDYAATEALGCVNTPSSCTWWKDGVEESGTCWNWVCPAGVSPATTCTTSSRERAWCGAVSQRKPPFHLSDSNYNAHPVPGYISWKDSNWECPTPIQPMTNSKDDLITYLESLNSRGDTYIAPGLMWGYRVLSPEAPFTEMSGHTITSSALVLMSDGMNSRSYRNWGSGSDHYGGDKAEANQITLETCDFIKSQKVEIYAIAFQVDDTDTQNMLKDCATSYTHYFDADSFAELKSAFNTVAGAFREIALTE